MIALRPTPVVARKTVAKASARRVVVKANQQTEKLAASVVTSMGVLAASPLMAHAEVTPSLKNLLQSVVAGGVVLALIAGAVTAVSNFDPVDRQ